MSEEPEPSYLRRLERTRRIVSRIFLFLALVVLLLVVALFAGVTMTGESGAAVAGTAAVLYLIGDKMLGLVDRFHFAARRASNGAAAEEGVRAILAGFRSKDYFVLNDIPSRAGNIDHLVVDRHGGVFLIETKSAKGRVEVSGEPVLLNGEPMPGDPIRQVLRNTM